jgi:geranylgeranylglycerol-phosphate geranylgeranyltransferase
MARASYVSRSFSTIFSGYWKLIRPLNALMAAVGAYIGYSLALQTISLNVNILYAMLSVFFISGAGQTINDFFDYEIDKKKKNSRPFVRGIISKQNGFIFSIALFTLGIILASFLNEETFWMAVFFSALLFLYSASMSKIKFVGNAVVALSVGFTFIFGASVAIITPLVLMIALAAFFANWTREIMKDVEDAHSDKGHKLTLPLLLNTHQTQFIILVLLALTILSGYLPTFLARGNVLYTVLVSISNIVFILAGKQLLDQHAHQAQSLLKKGMMVALLAQLSLLV